MNSNYDSWKTAAPEGDDSPEGCTKDCEGYPECQPDAELPREPPVGSWASIARIMAEGDTSGFDWDTWKDEMKERE